MANKKLTREDLVELAKEMNTVMGLVPKILVNKKVTYEQLMENITKEATGQIYEFDFVADPNDSEKPYFSANAAEIIRILRIPILKDEGDEVAEEVEDEEFEGEEEEAVEEEAVEEDIVEEVKPAKKTKEPKEELKEDKSVRGKGVKYTRAQSIADALRKKKNMTYKELEEESGKLFAEKNGVAYDPDYTNWYMKYSLPIFEELGIMKKKSDGTLVFNLF